jgi:hypothetical protein
MREEFSSNETWRIFFAMRNDPYAAIRVEVIRAVVDQNVRGAEADLVISQYLGDQDALVRSYAEWVRDNRTEGTPTTETWLLETRLGWWGPGWNMSRDDPWWRDWLTSEELFRTYSARIRSLGRPVGALMDGTIYDFDSGRSCHVRVWMSATEIIGMYSSEFTANRSNDFVPLIADLRNAPALELGRVRGDSSYGAYYDVSTKLIIKWAQAGDWAAMVRNWHLEYSP